MFAIGEIAQVYSPIAGKKKFHLCVCCANEHGVERFLFINSGAGYEGDFILDDTEIKCLPDSPTGKSVVSCSLVVRYSSEQLKKYNAKKLGDLDFEILAKLALFFNKTTVLSKEDRDPVAGSLTAYIQSKKG